MKMTDACLAMLWIARNQVGVHEIGGPEAEKMIVEYAKHTTLKATSDEVAWCSSFANYVVDKAGEQYGFKGTGSAAARSWLDWGVVLEQPIKGCIVVLERKDKNNPNSAHVTFFDSYNRDGTIACIGGNQKDSVKSSDYDQTRVLGYRAPKVSET